MGFSRYRAYLFAACKENRVFILSTQLSAGEETPVYSSNGKIIKNQSQYRNESIYAPVSKRFNYFFQKRTLFCD